MTNVSTTDESREKMLADARREARTGPAEARAEELRRPPRKVKAH